MTFPSTDNRTVVADSACATASVHRSAQIDHASAAGPMIGVRPAAGDPVKPNDSVAITGHSPGRGNVRVAGSGVRRQRTKLLPAAIERPPTSDRLRAVVAQN